MSKQLKQSSAWTQVNIMSHFQLAEPGNIVPPLPLWFNWLKHIRMQWLFSGTLCALSLPLCLFIPECNELLLICQLSKPSLLTSKHTGCCNTLFFCLFQEVMPHLWHSWWFWCVFQIDSLMLLPTFPASWSDCILIFICEHCSEAQLE